MMSHLNEVVCETAPVSDRARFTTRVLSATILVTFIFVLSYLLLSGFRAFTDSWVAPVNLSPDNDKVIALEIQLNSQLAEKERITAEQIRIEGEYGASASALNRLKEIKNKLEDMADWNAKYQTKQYSTLGELSANLNKQKKQIQKLLEGNQKILKDAQRQLAAGLIGKTEYDKQIQAYEGSKLTLKEITRKKIETELLLSNVEQERNAWVGRTQADPGKITGTMPTVLAHEEAKARMDNEILKLESHLTALDFEKQAIKKTLAKMDEILEHIKSRPMYRAMEIDLELAFVPYEELKGIAVGHSINKCIFSFFHCQKVGVIAEIVPGEVVTQDPWGELARGQYVVLNLLEKSAIREKTLRIRRP